MENWPLDLASWKSLMSLKSEAQWIFGNKSLIGARLREWEWANWRLDDYATIWISFAVNVNRDTKCPGGKVGQERDFLREEK